MNYLFLVTTCLTFRLSMALVGLFDIPPVVRYLLCAYYLMYASAMFYQYSKYVEGVSVAYFTKDPVYWNNFRIFHGIMAIAFSIVYFLTGERALVVIPLLDWLVALVVIIKH